MLTLLSIKSFTIVKELELDFEHGMNVFTGETGAGKSIIIDALSLALGARADTSVIRSGESLCEICASFDISNNPLAVKWLVDNEVNGEELILRRVIHLNGRSKSFINGSPYPLQKVRALGERLINIHGQHQQYHLLKHENHRQQLDAFAMNDELLAKVSTLYRKLARIDKDILELKQSENHSHQLELLKYQVAELDELALKPNDVEKLSEEQSLLSKQHDFITLSEHMLYRLSGETDTNIIAGLHQVKQHGETLAQSYPELKGFNEMMQSAVINCEEALNEFDHFQSQLDVNPERLQQVEHRLERIFDIARKHHVKAQQLHLHHQELTCKLKTLQNASKEAVKLEALRQQAFKDYEKLCAKLRQKRHKEASVLASQITKTIKALGMPNGLVEIQIEAIQQPYAHGMDKIEYYVRPNQGFEPQPLSKIASGGELSRISLAIQVLTAEKKSYPTLIFDEVDTGIGGVTAAAVGQLLQRLGNHTQVFCVTHQAQVASNALHHFMVEKTTKNKQTYSDICKLNDKDRIDELARMLSGLKVTKQTKAHAKELLSQAQDNKQCA